MYIPTDCNNKVNGKFMITYFSCFFHLRVVTRVEICIGIPDADKHLFPLRTYLPK